MRLRMRNFKKLQYIYVIIAMYFFAGCASMPYSSEKTMTTDIQKDQLSRTEYYGKMADNLYEQGKYQDSLDYYRLSLLHDAKNQNSRFGLAQAYAHLEQTALALTEFNTLIKQVQGKLSDEQMQVLNAFYEKAGSLDALYQLNQFRFEQMGSPLSLWKMYEISLKQRKYARALDALHLMEANEFAPKDKEYLVDLSYAEVLFQQKKYAQSLERIQLAERQKPLNELVLNQKIKVLTSLKQWKDVITEGLKYNKYQNRAIAISEKIADAAVKTENYDVAADELQWQVEVSPTKDIPRLKLAHVYFLTKNYEEAERQYGFLVSIPDYTDEVKFYLSYIYFQSDRRSSAINNLENISPYSEYYGDAQAKLAEINSSEGNVKAALKRLETAFQTAGAVKTSALLYKVYSDLLIDQGQFQRAASVLKTALNYNISNEYVHANLAYCYYKMHKSNDFKNEISYAIKAFPQNVKIYETLAKLWHKDSQRMADAEYFAQQALKLNEQSEELMQILARIYIDQNKLDQAALLFEELYDKNPRNSIYLDVLAKIYSLKNIKTKADQYASYSGHLKSYGEIKSYLNSLFQKPNVDISEQRFPASLE